MGARLDWPARSVDQRVKIPRWLAEFEARGGTLVIREATVDHLEQLARANDLLIVAAGRGTLGGLFSRDDEKSPYEQPQRALALTYVTGIKPPPEQSGISFNLIPGIGEYLVFPALTTAGPSEIMVFEGVPGGPMDCWAGVKTPAEHLQRSLQVLDTFLPWEADRCSDIGLTDTNGVLVGRLAPVVRHPIAHLPSRAPVLGMADAVVLNDPITGQGSNNAAKCAEIYLAAILEQGEEPFTPQWMQRTFDRYWRGYAQWVVSWTNTLLAPPQPHVVKSQEVV